MDLLACARFEMNTLKSAQGDKRRTLDWGELEKELHDLIPCDLSRIGHRHIGAHGLSVSNCLRRQAEIALAEFRVAESVAKCIKRLAAEISIRPVRHPVVFEVRQLVDPHVKSHWQTPGRIVFPAKGLSHRRAALFAGIPRLKDGVGMFVDSVDGQSTPIEENDRDGFAAGGHSFHEVFFRLGEIDAGAISTDEAGFADRHFFALELTGNPYHRNDCIGILRGGDRFGRRPIIRLGPDEFRMRLAVAAAIGDFEGDFVALLEVDATNSR